jgi:hypothetical protein
MLIRLWWERHKEKCQYEHQDIVGRIILEWNLRDMEWGGEYWISLAHDMEI